MISQKQQRRYKLGIIELPETERDPELVAGLCDCRPICKNRRREWKGELQRTSEELLLERRPVDECIRRYPKKVFPNKPCPLFAKSKRVVTQQKYVEKVTKVVRLCDAPIDDVVSTPYLRAAELAKANGALDMVKACCPFCMCGRCCACGRRQYPTKDPDRDYRRRSDMREFDNKVQKTYQEFRIMYQ